MNGEESRPHEEDPAKPDRVGQIQGRTWKHVLKRTVFETVDDQITDLAAALTYYAVLSIFPALIALVSILGLVGRAQSTVDQMIDLMGSFVPADAMSQLEPIVANLMDQQGAGLGVVIGLVTALWTASNYVAAFARGMNRIYEIDEGRPIWKLRPLLYGITAVVLDAGCVGLRAGGGLGSGRGGDWRGNRAWPGGAGGVEHPEVAGAPRRGRWGCCSAVLLDA